MADQPPTPKKQKTHDDDENPLLRPVCQYGAACIRKNPQHIATHYHPPTNPCKYGNTCNRKNPDHFAEFKHPDDYVYPKHIVMPVVPVVQPPPPNPKPKANAGILLIDDELEEKEPVTPKAEEPATPKQEEASSTTDDHAPVKKVIAEPVSASDIPKSKSSKSPPNFCIQDKVFVLTGTLSILRKDFIALLSKHGGSVAEGISKKVDYLITEDPTTVTSKTQKAIDLDIPIIGEDVVHDFIASQKGATETPKSSKLASDDPVVIAACVGLDVIPKNIMKDGDTHKVEGGQGQYEIRFRGGVYYCTCTAWKFQNLGTDVRTCKHLREHLGDEFETARVGHAGVAPAKVEKIAVPALLLAEKYNENKDYTGWWMSEKLDGVRAYWNGKKFISRLGNVFYAPDWFTEKLPKNNTLDGELFGGRKAFQSTISIVKSQNQSDSWKKLKFMIFDIPSMSDSPYEERLQSMKDIVQELKEQGVTHAEAVENRMCTGKEHLEQYLSTIEGLGGEGIMLRQPKSKYVGSRSSTLLKVKTFHDDEALVIGHTEGKGKYVGLTGALEVESKTGKKFQIGSGLTDSDRANPPKVGSVVTYRYQELTDGGIPRFPTYVGIRIDVKWPKKLSGVEN